MELSREVPFRFASNPAVKQLSLKFEKLNNEFKVLYARNPIHHIEGRVKATESIAAKLQKKGLPLTVEAARERINDIAGVRVVCSYIDDVYRVAEMLERQTDIEIVKRQDYILYTQLQWLPLAASGYPYAGVSVRPGCIPVSRARKSAVKYHR